MSELARRLKDFGRTIGFERIGITSANPPSDYSRYLEWIDRGRASEMWYMTETLRKERRGDLQRVLPGARSVIVGVVSYAPEDPEHPSDAKFARYAWGEDYHHVLKKKLHELVEWLTTQVEEPFGSRVYVDTGPILERSLAERAGIGWIGKNTCIIDESAGSYLLLGEILTTLELPEDRPAINRCGSCTRCLDACPTGALVDPFQLDSNRCISYQTLENRSGSIPQDVAEKMNGWVAGCDICQEVCPWNRDAPSLRLPQLQAGPHIELTLEQLKTIDESTFLQKFDETSLKRTGSATLRRNASAV